MFDDCTIHTALITVDLYLPGAQSLKARRSVLRSLKDRLRAKFNLAVAEVGPADQWQRAVLALALISGDRRYLEQNISAVRSYLDNFYQVQITNSRVELL